MVSWNSGSPVKTVKWLAMVKSVAVQAAMSSTEAFDTGRNLMSVVRSKN